MTRTWSLAVRVALSSPDAADLSSIAGFRPPAHSHLKNNDLERYNVRTDAWCLVTLAGLLVSLTGAIPSHITSAPINKAALISKPYAKAAIMWTMFHHVATAFGSYDREHLSCYLHLGNVD